jgi:hypothetical protein
MSFGKIDQLVLTVRRTVRAAFLQADFFVLKNTSVSRSSSVSIVSGYGLDDRGSILGRGKSIFPVASVSRPALGTTQPPIQWVLGVFSPGVKCVQCVTPLSSAEVVNE